MKDRLKALRAALKITQFELADKANIGRSTYAMFETGDRIPKELHVTAICAVTGASPDWLRYGTGEMFTPADESALDQLVAKHHLRPMEKTILEAFVKLPEEHRDGVVAYIETLVASVVADNQQYQNVVDQHAARENQALREAFGLPSATHAGNNGNNGNNGNDGDQKAHA